MASSAVAQTSGEWRCRRARAHALTFADRTVKGTRMQLALWRGEMSLALVVTGSNQLGGSWTNTGILVSWTTMGLAAHRRKMSSI